MIIRIGSKNPVKVQAVQDALQKFKSLETSILEIVDAASDVSTQPIGLEETVKGAKNRAQNAFYPKTLSIGIESGVLHLNEHATNAFVIAACSVFDGKNHFLGLSPAFELPQNLTQKIIEEKLEVDKAAHALGLTSDSRVGYSKGMIHVFTNKRFSRKDQLKQAAILAFSRWEQKDTYF